MKANDDLTDGLRDKTDAERVQFVRDILESVRCGQFTTNTDSECTMVEFIIFTKMGWTPKPDLVHRLDKVVRDYEQYLAALRSPQTTRK